MSHLSRRTLVAGAAAMPVAAIPIATQAQAGPDPIFAVIEKHRVLEAAFFALAEHEDALQGAGHELIPAPGEYSRTPEMVAAVTASIAARCELANTSPTTLAGLIAYIEYVNANSDEDQLVFDDGEETLAFLRSLLQTTQGLARL
jgi:hypothetical protein